MPIIDLQRRLREIGRIRIGEKGVSSTGKPIPKKLDTFRLTSSDREVLTTAAHLFGGAVSEWEDAPAGEQWEVTTETAALPIVIPPGGVAMTQHYELWAGGGCKRRCDGAHELIGDQPCVCDPEARECKPHTRLSVMLRDLPGLGVWRLDTSGWYAAVELAGAIEMVEWAAQSGRMLPARLRLEQRSVKREGEQVRRFAVPVIDLDVTIASLAGAMPAAPSTPLSVGGEVVTLEAPAFTPIAVAELPEAPSVPVAQQVAEAGRPARAPRQNAAAPIPATGLRPRTLADLPSAVPADFGTAVSGDLLVAVPDDDVVDDPAGEALATRQLEADIREHEARLPSRSDPPPAPKNEPSDKQIRMLMAIYNGLGIRQDDDKKRISATLLSLDGGLASHKDLTPGQASMLIDMVKALDPFNDIVWLSEDASNPDRKTPYILGSEPGAEEPPS